MAKAHDNTSEPVLRFTEDHFWVRVEDDVALFGISEIGQLKAGEILAIELPDIGERVECGEVCGEIETARTVLEIRSPITGSVAAVNSELEEQPSLANEDPYSEGWLFEVTLDDLGELDDLLSSDEYEELVAEEEA